MPQVNHPHAPPVPLLPTSLGRHPHLGQEMGNLVETHAAVAKLNDRVNDLTLGTGFRRPPLYGLDAISRVPNALPNRDAGAVQC